jgi:hypothetical protein
LNFIKEDITLTTPLTTNIYYDSHKYGYDYNMEA